METKEKTPAPEQEKIIINGETNSAIQKFRILKLKLHTKIIVLLILLILLIGGILLSIIHSNNSQLTTISKSSLLKVVDISELSTVDYTYNAIATKHNENNEAMYYVAYEGIVTAGIDFNEIGFDIIESDKTIKITLPEVKIHDININIGTMEYIFTKGKYETESISQEAHKLCIDDLESRIENEDMLYSIAKENAISSINALFKPWLDTIDKNYRVEIN